MNYESTMEKQMMYLEGQLTGYMFSGMELKDQIYNLDLKLKGVKPMGSHIDCAGCGFRLQTIDVIKRS